MSFDHKPTDPGMSYLFIYFVFGRGSIPWAKSTTNSFTGEQARVEQAGGRVKDGRVNEHLALSRAFGDFDFKGNKSSHPESQPVSIHPDITSHKLADDVEFVVLACDGEIPLSNQLSFYLMGSTTILTSTIHEQVSGIARPPRRSLTVCARVSQRCCLWRRSAKTS